MSNNNNTNIFNIFKLFDQNKDVMRIVQYSQPNQSLYYLDGEREPINLKKNIFKTVSDKFDDEKFLKFTLKKNNYIKAKLKTTVSESEIDDYVWLRILLIPNGTIENFNDPIIAIGESMIIKNEIHILNLHKIYEFT